MKSLTTSVVATSLSVVGLNTTTEAVPAQLTAKHSFTVGEKEFLLDGKPFVIRGGEIHYTRIPREYWRHRLQMCKAMGLNAVGVYLFWNFHEWEEGKFDWSGQRDAAEFCRIAQEEGLWVILRPGPYVCSEWEMGGLPWWLLKHQDIRLRSTDPRFMEPTKRYLNEVGRVFGPLQVTQGGPILMVQVENEYGWFAKDAAYMGAIRDAIQNAGFHVPLYACNPQNVIENGYRSDIFQVVNFGANGARQSFEKLAQFQKTGPLMNGEYYPGWFDSWGHKHSVGSVKPVLNDLEFMLKNRYSFSLYMAHGGSNFGLWAGACTDKPFMPVATSYDYDAPISEAGWVTPKFEAVRSLFAKHLNDGETLSEAPTAIPVIEIPAFALSEVSPLADNLTKPRRDEVPGTMEAYGQSRGCILYRTTLPAGPAGSLTVKAIHDFAWVSLGGKQVGVMDRRTNRFKVELPARKSPARLEILVEAMGRVNFGPNFGERKGLLNPVQFAPLGGDATELKGWEALPIHLDDQPPASLKYQPVSPHVTKNPAFWRGSFTLQKTGDTFLDVSGLGKGILWLNGRCLGRFWNIGPTQTLYVPAPWLKVGKNEVDVFDITGPHEAKLAGLSAPILDQIRPELDITRRTRATGTFNIGDLTPVSSGEFSAAVEYQRYLFARTAKGRYFCLEAISAHDGKPFTTVADLDLLDAQGEIMNMPKPGWEVLWVDSEETNAESGEAENAFDSRPDTFWHTEWSANQPHLPHRLVIDLGESQTLTGFRYLPRAGQLDAAGRIKEYRVYLSDQPFGLQPAK